MLIASTAKIGEKHRESLQITYPSFRFLFYNNIDEVIEEAADSEVLITYGEDLSIDSIERLPKLRWIQVISAGIEKMPLETMKQKGILVTNARGIHGIPMAEYTLGVMLYHVRKFDAYYQNQRQNLWDRSPHLTELTGKTLGIIGAGAIGREIARKAKAFDMRVLGLSRSGQLQKSFDQVYTISQKEVIFKESDFIVDILPLTPDTKQFIGEKEFQIMKSDAVFINISRGATIDESALINALKNKKIAAAYLDVFEQEPLPKEYPFWNLDNCWLTPHISGRSEAYMKRALEIFAENLKHWATNHRGKMINVIDLNNGY